MLSFGFDVGEGKGGKLMLVAKLQEKQKRPDLDDAVDGMNSSQQS